MDRVNFLKRMGRLCCLPELTDDEVRLYIFLVIHCDEKKGFGKIDARQVEKCGGKKVTLADLRTMMLSLKNRGLAEMEDVKRSRHGAWEMTYRIVCEGTTPGKRSGRKKIKR